MKKQIETIYSLILKDGLRQTKFKNSHLKPVSSAEEGNKGAIFGFRTKSNMTKARGVEDNLRQINTFYIDFDITTSAEAKP